MREFSYEALDGEGVTVQGRVEAKTEKEARNNLRKKELFVVELAVSKHGALPSGKEDKKIPRTMKSIMESIPAWLVGFVVVVLAVAVIHRIELPKKQAREQQRSEVVPRKAKRIPDDQGPRSPNAHLLGVGRRGHMDDVHEGRIRAEEVGESWIKAQLSTSFSIFPPSSCNGESWDRRRPPDKTAPPKCQALGVEKRERAARVRTTC